MVWPDVNINPPQVYTCSPSWTSLPPPSPYHPSRLSQRTSPKHPVSCIKPGLAIHLTHDIIHVSMPFSQIIPPSPLPTESKRSPSNLDFSFCFIQPGISHMHSSYKLNKHGDNIQPWRTPFPIWNQSVVPCTVLTVAYSLVQLNKFIWFSCFCYDYSYLQLNYMIL